MKGGYKIIDLKGINLVTDGSGVTIKGIYDSIESSTKPILLEGLVVDNIERLPRYVTFGVDSGNLVSNIALTANVNIVYLTVTSDDLVTITTQ